MARYSYDFMGIRGNAGNPRGMDPNYRGGYGGMRMHGDDAQAAYGRHRATHPEDFQGSGGFRGARGGYDRGWGGGGVRDLRNDPRAMRDFNANSPVVRYGGDYGRRRYGSDYGRGGAPRRAPEHFQGERFDYANRGLGSGGYGEGWAWGPMRGAR